MQKTFLISIATMTATTLVTILAAALCRNAMAIVVYALVCVVAAVISGIIVADIEDSLYSYSWLFYMGGHMMVTITLLLSEWDIPKTQVSTIVIIPFIISAIFCALAE